MNKLKIFTLAALLFLVGAAQAKVIRGTVTDQTGETIISASVVVKGTTIGTVTDFDGNYELDVPDNAQVLVFSYIGLETQEVNITGTVINVTLRENSEVLEEVVVTGYGVTKKRDLVTSVASVSADQLKDIPVTSAAEALQGKLAGVTVTTTEGSPDADIKIRVRGGTSLTQSNDPLYIVDGFPVSSISDISPSDIASMDVLKDAAATAIYGAQGANGVIIITTKETSSDGDKMAFHVDYTGYMGWRQVASHYDMLNLQEFIRLQYESAYMYGKDKMDNNFHRYFDPQYQINETMSPLTDIYSYWGDQPLTDWQDETFGRHGLNSNHSFSVSGGNKNANFTLSYNRVDDEGIMYGSDYSRNNLSLKTKFKPIKDLTIAFSTRYTNTEVLGSGTNTQENAGSTTESRVRDAIGYAPVELYNLHRSDDDDDQTSSKNIYDPITTINDNYRKKIDNKLTLNGSVSYKFLKHFTIKAELGYETRDVMQDRFYGPSAYYSRQGEGATKAGEMYLGNAIVTDTKSSRLKETNTFEYAQRFNQNHNFSLLIGEEQTITKSELRTNKYYGFDANMTGEQVFNYLGLAKNWSGSNYISPNDNMLSFFARANYDYMGRYYITATFRADGSTRFAKGNQWGYFPSVAVAWRMSDESWMEGANSWLSNMKWRLSYGTAGNNNVDLGYLSFDYVATPTSWTDISQNMLTVGAGSSEIIAANNNLKWETTVTRDLGLDLGFFNERLTVTLDGYWNTTNDLILKYVLPTAYNAQYRNIGSTDNKGFEVSINGVVLDHKSKDLSYNLTIGANLSLNRTRIVSLGDMDEYSASVGCLSTYYSGAEYVMHPGDLVGNIYGYRSNGIWTPDDFAGGYDVKNNNWLGADGKVITTPLGNAYPGMTKIGGIDEEGNYNKGETEVLGNALPKFNGGFNIAFNIGSEKWGKFDLAANFTYSYGNDVLNFSALDYTTIVSNTTALRNNNGSLTWANRYSMFDADGNFIPANYTQFASKNIVAYGTDAYAQLTAELAANNANYSEANPYCTSLVLTDKYVEDASYLRFSALTIGYSLPQRLLTKAYIQNLRIFFTANNLFCATSYSGADPEVDTRSKKNPLLIGVDYSAFPKNRSFNFGLNLSF